jgi:hypothetical protein
MGVYFAATGFGNKLAGSIGEASQSEPVGIELVAQPSELMAFNRADTLIANDKSISIRSTIYLENGDLTAVSYDQEGLNTLALFKFEKEERKNEVIEVLKENNATKDAPYHATFEFEKDGEAKKVIENRGDGKDYSGTFRIEEIQTKKEFNTFLFIFILTLVFGLLVIALLKPLKRLTHGAEDNEGTINDETEGFELADNN